MIYRAELRKELRNRIADMFIGSDSGGYDEADAVLELLHEVVYAQWTLADQTGIRVMEKEGYSRPAAAHWRGRVRALDEVLWLLQPRPDEEVADVGGGTGS